MGRYSMRGLQSYDDLGAFMTGEDLKDALMASGSGAVGILATSFLLSKLPADMVADPTMNSRLKSLIGVGVGVLGGRAIFMYGNRDAAMGFVGAVAGASFASLIASWAPETFPSVALAGGGLSDMDIRALEATVASNDRAWTPPSQLSSPSVMQQTLRGTETSTEEIAAYTHFMGDQGAPPPSF